MLAAVLTIYREQSHLIPTAYGVSANGMLTMRILRHIERNMPKTKLPTLRQNLIRNVPVWVLLEAAGEVKQCKSD